MDFSAARSRPKEDRALSRMPAKISRGALGPAQLMSMSSTEEASPFT